MKNVLILNRKKHNTKTSCTEKLDMACWRNVHAVLIRMVKTLETSWKFNCFFLQ